MELPERSLVRPYEVVILMHPDATEDQQKELMRRNKSIIESFSGALHHIDSWGRRNLANPINKNSRAYFFHATFTAGPKAINELERTMRINERVLRFTHTRLADGTNLTQYLENYKKALADSAAREREREQKNQARKAMARAGREGGGFREGGGGRDGGGFGGGGAGGPRGDRPDRGDREFSREPRDSGDSRQR